ncbi:acylglycerol kinase family protein [Neobacillus sp. LXY-4]|uniref:acylglycerol kinase family protein n=1 Tax=Neobacillus sp. LXY-4 TaxID=3379826 RepID=UPI003EE32574
MGGDGTVYEVINGMVSYPNAVLGIIPCGSGNDFARGFSIPTDPRLALNLIIRNANKQPEYIGVGKIIKSEKDESNLC